MNKPRYVSEEYLLALMPRPLEVLAQLIWVPGATIGVTQTLFWISGATMRPRFTLTVALIGWAVFVVAFSAWLRMFRTRRRVLAAQDRSRPHDAS